IRADRETVEPLADTAARDVAARAASAMASAAIVVLSDYGKGVLADARAGRLIETAVRAGRPVIVDPKGDDFARYRGATLLTPNRRELAEASRMPVGDDAAIAAAARAVISACGVDGVLCTRSAE